MKSYYRTKQEYENTFTAPQFNLEEVRLLFYHRCRKRIAQLIRQHRRIQLWKNTPIRKLCLTSLEKKIRLIGHELVTKQRIGQIVSEAESKVFYRIGRPLADKILREAAQRESA